MTLLGVVAGLGLALIAGRFLQALLFDTSARDPLVLAVVAASLIVVAVAASVLPARRASGVDPMVALRAE